MSSCLLIRVFLKKEMMTLEVNLPLEDALDLGWKILADCFSAHEVGIKEALIQQFWPPLAATEH